MDDNLIKQNLIENIAIEQNLIGQNVTEQNLIDKLIEDELKIEIPPTQNIPAKTQPEDFFHNGSQPNEFPSQPELITPDPLSMDNSAVKDEYSFENLSPMTRKHRLGRPRSLPYSKPTRKYKVKKAYMYRHLKKNDSVDNLENSDHNSSFIFKNTDLKMNRFTKGMSLEAVDPINQNMYCVVTVSAVAGARIRLNFDGFDRCYDFWVEIDSVFIFPVGWCSKNGKTLQFPADYLEFDWETYLEKEGRFAAPVDLFREQDSNKAPGSFFEVGMKLVAVESDHLPVYAVNRIATVVDILGDFLLLQFEESQTFSGFWAKADSNFVRCLYTFDDELEVPEGFQGEFTKAKYLETAESPIAPQYLFNMRQPIGYIQGLRIETVDNYNHEIIRQATIALVKGYRIKIHLNGWPKPYDYWLDDDSPLIYPLGHCSKYGLDLSICLPPSKNKNISCSTTICRGMGHFSGRPNCTHEKLVDCPYKNHKPSKLRTRLFPDVSDTVESVINSVESVKRGRLSTHLNVVDTSSEISHSSVELTQVKRRKRPFQWRINADNGEKSPSVNDSNYLTRKCPGKNYPLEELFDPPKFSRLKEAVNILQPHIQPKKSEVERWSCGDVAKCISCINGCGDIVARVFSYNKINGEALLLMQQSDLTDVLKLKLGPALKIYYHILIFKESHVLLSMCD